MKQRYTVLKAQEDDRILIREEGELDKDLFFTQCTVSFAQGALQDVLGQGVFPAIQLIRSKDFYPALPVAEKIVEGIRRFFDDGSQPVEVEINDVDFITKRSKPVPVPHVQPDAETDEEPGDLDDLLEDDAEEFDDDFALDDINPSLKIADEEVVDIDDEQ
ncbi:MAG: hypothetical protein ABIL58_05245 [Pseudomonadota bacterium]